jgi:hypothetical protein
MSLHPYGCRVVQAALQGLPGEHKVALARELEGHIMKVLESQHGNHVVQRIVETVSGLPLRRRCCHMRRIVRVPRARPWVRYRSSYGRPAHETRLGLSLRITLICLQCVATSYAIAAAAFRCR